MKPAAFVSDGASLEHTIEDLRALNAKIFATPKACDILEAAGIHAVPLGDPVGINRIFGFGHKEIHLFGFDLSGEAGTRVCFENRVFFTTADQAAHAQMLLAAAMALAEKGAAICVHGDGMFPHMANTVMRNATQRTLTAIYDLQVCPPTFEFFSFITQAEKYRAENGFAQIDVLFLPGPMHGFRDDDLPPALPERVSMLQRICAAGARLVPTVRNVHILKARTHVEGDIFPPKWTNERPQFVYGPRFQKGGHQCLQATEAARAEIARRFPKPYATITMREAEYWPQRNSSFAGWSRGARQLQTDGLQPVIVPDTHGAGIPGFTNFDLAAWDIDLRMALYECAALNMGVANGPMALLHLSKCPYVMFQLESEETPTTQDFHDAQGVHKGSQYSDNGWTLWEQDTPENVTRAIERWFKREAVA